jgi:SP family myo-inositol transporter-like MFS transporter 13
VVSSAVAGAIFGSLISGILMDNIGRKRVAFLSSLVFVLGAIVLSSSMTFQSLLLGRIIVGIAIGCSSMCMPVYVSEVSPSNQRGFLVTCINVAITFGQFLSSCIDGAYADVSNGWRYMLGLAAVPAMIQAVGILFLPESPRWLLEKDKTDAAVVALQKLRGTLDVRVEIQEVLSVIQARKDSEILGHLISEFSDKESESASVSGMDTPLLKSPEISIDKVVAAPIKPNSFFNHPLFHTTNLRALSIGCCLQAVQQFAGINTVMYYSATILKLAGFTSDLEAIYLSIVVSFCNFIGSLVGLYLCDRVGRRKLTLTSLSSVIVALLAISFSFFYSQRYSNKIGCWLILTFICIYLLVFAYGMGTMPWTISAEIFPTNIRGVANSITTMTNWICNFIVASTFLTLVNILTKPGAFITYAVVSTCFLIFLYIYLPETKGKPLEEIRVLFTNNMWGKNVNIFRNSNSRNRNKNNNVNRNIIPKVKLYDEEDSQQRQSSVHI